MTDEDTAVRTSGLARLIVVAVAVVMGAAAVTLAATFVAGTDNTRQVAADAAVYGASESALTALTATHARLSETITATSATRIGQPDEERVNSVQDALTEFENRYASLDAETDAFLLSAGTDFVQRSNDALEFLEVGVVPPNGVLEGIEETYSTTVDEIVGVRAEAATVIEAAQVQAGTLTTAARAFVLVVVPLLALTGVYRSLAARQRRKELEMRLESERAYREERDLLIASVGHELRTPLTGVLGLAVSLRDNSRDFGPAEKAALIETIADEAQELAHRIDDLMAVTRLDSDLLTTTTERVDIRAVIAGVTRGWESRSRTRLTVTGQGMVRADPHHVEHVIRNLLTCAARSGGEMIDVAIRPGNMVLNIEIRDDGAIQEPADASSIFSVENSPTTRMGVGMAAAIRLTEQMGGSYELTRSEGWNVSLVKLPLAPVVVDDDAFKADLVLDPQRTRPARRDLKKLTAGHPPEIHYSPIVSLRAADFGAVVGYEAQPRFAFGQPRAWFGEAAHLGLSTEVELAVLRAAIAGFDRPPDVEFLLASLSKSTLVSSSIKDAIKGIPPGRLVLQMSETGIFDNGDDTRRTIDHLGDLGYRTALGPAGLRDTNLWQLLRTRPSLIKLASATVAELMTNEDLRAIVSRLVVMGELTAISVIAEGVDDSSMVPILQELGVGLGQGLLFDEGGDQDEHETEPPISIESVRRLVPSDRRPVFQHRDGGGVVVRLPRH